jgi:uncharacterized membrane protein YkvA (DUF1232 family)
MASSMRRAAAFTAIWKALMSSKGGPGIGQRLVAVPKMVWHSLTGRYDGLGRVVLMALASVYILSPLDFIPEIALGPIGLIDDAAVAVWIAGALLSETERFLAWEHIRKGKKGAPPGAVVDGEVA